MVSKNRVLRFPKPVFSQFIGNCAGRSVNPRSYCFKAFRPVVLCIHSRHYCQEGPVRYRCWMLPFPFDMLFPCLQRHNGVPGYRLHRLIRLLILPGILRLCFLAGCKESCVRASETHRKSESLA
jgi:hypothetical protein